MTRHPENLSEISMMDLFRMELDFQLKTLDEMIVKLEEKPNDREVLESLMRGAHSIKGAGRMVEAYAIVQLAHAMEEVFVSAQREQNTLNRQHIDVLFNALDMIHYIAKQSDNDIVKWNEFHRQELDELIARLGAVANKTKILENIDAETENTFAKQLVEDDVPIKVAGDAMRLLQVDTSRINRLLGYAGESLVESHRFSQARRSLVRHKKHNYQLVEQIDQLRTLFDKSASLEVIRSKLNQIAGMAATVRQELSEHLVQLDNFDRRNTTLAERMHKELLNTRMRSFSAVVQGWPRFVRDISRRLGKDARIEMSGMATLVDREVLERINIPLKHIIQNAIDHGIEMPDERERKGKNRVGTIAVHVRHNAGLLYVNIQDDGSGIDIDDLKQKIVKRGLSSRSEVKNKTNEELFDYLFEAGFSTRDEVNDLSGRGVGLDIVKETITQLSGSVTVKQGEHHGMQFELVLPLTISVMRVLTMQLGGELYAVPMARVHRVLEIPLDVVKKDTTYYVEWEGKRITLVHGNYVFRIPTAKVKSETILPMVVFEQHGELFGWIVEALLGENELSIQRLDSLLGKIPGITAASIRQDGMLVLILDANEIISLIKQTTAQQSPDLCLTTLLKTSSRKSVLVVDRARSSRERLKRLLLGQKYDVAEDSTLDACLKHLQEKRFDLIVLVLEENDNFPVHLQDDARFDRQPILFVVDGEKPVTNPKLPWRYMMKMDFQAEQFIYTANRLLQG